MTSVVFIKPLSLVLWYRPMAWPVSWTAVRKYEGRRTKRTRPSPFRTGRNRPVRSDLATLPGTLLESPPCASCDAAEVNRRTTRNMIAPFGVQVGGIPPGQHGRMAFRIRPGTSPLGSTRLLSLWSTVMSPPDAVTDRLQSTPPPLLQRRFGLAYPVRSQPSPSAGRPKSTMASRPTTTVPLLFLTSLPGNRC